MIVNSINSTTEICQELLQKISLFSKQPKEKHEQEYFIECCKEITYQNVISENSIWKSKFEPIYYLRKNKIKTGKTEEKVVIFLFEKYFRFKKPCYVHYNWICKKINILKVNLVRTLRNLEQKNIIGKITWRDYKDKNYRTIIFPIIPSSDTTPKQVRIGSDTTPGITCTNNYLISQKNPKTITYKKYNIHILNNLISINTLDNTSCIKSKKLLRNSPQQDCGASLLSLSFSNKGDVKKMDIIKRYKLKTKPENLTFIENKFFNTLRENKFFGILKENNFDIDSLQGNNRNNFVSIINNETGINFENIFKFPIKQIKSKQYLNSIKKLRMMFIELFIKGYSIDFNFCKNIIEKWNLITENHKNILQKTKINIKSQAFIHAATTITYTLHIRANSQVNRILSAIDRISRKEAIYKNPIYNANCSGKKVNITSFFGNFLDQKYLEGYLEINEDLYEAYTDYMFSKKRKESKYKNAHRIFKKWIIDIIFDGDIKKSEPILLRFNYKISDMIDKLIEESKMRKMEGLKLFSSTGNNQPALLYYYLFSLEEYKLKFSRKKPHIFDIIDYTNWLRFVDKIVHDELGYYDFWKKQANN